MARYDSALSDLNKAIQLAPQYPGYFSQRAGLHDKMGNKELAEADRKKAKELGGN